MMDRLEEDLQRVKKHGLEAGKGEEYAAQMDYTRTGSAKNYRASPRLPLE